MRKIITILLLVCLSISVFQMSSYAIYPIHYYSRMELEAYYEANKDDEYFAEHFIFPDEVEILGTFRQAEIGTSGSGYFYYYLTFSWDENTEKRVELGIFPGQLTLEHTIDNQGLQLIPIQAGMNYVDGSMVQLKYELLEKDDELMLINQYHVIKRGKLEYVYWNGLLNYIGWEQNDITYRLRLVDGFSDLPPGDNIISNLLSQEVESFLAAQEKLLSIGNSTPSAPEISCGKDYPHSYSDQWRSDAYTHYNLCSCGAKGNEGFHADENQDGACDICNYDPNAKVEPDPDPVVDPTEPSQPPTEPATQPTAQPTTTPATQPTASTPAEPQSPAPGLWIGISAVGILAVAAMILVIRKKKTE